PQHFVVAQVAQLDARRHRDRVARGELLRIEARRLDLHRRHFTREQRVDAGVLRKDLILPAADELRADLLRQQRLEVEDRRAVRKCRYPDGLDVGGQKRAAARQRVAAPRGDKDTKGTKDTKGFHETTTLTRGPLATTTFRI